MTSHLHRPRPFFSCPKTWAQKCPHGPRLTLARQLLGVGGSAVGRSVGRSVCGWRSSGRGSGGAAFRWWTHSLASWASFDFDVTIQLRGNVRRVDGWTRPRREEWLLKRHQTETLPACLPACLPKINSDNLCFGGGSVFRMTTFTSSRALLSVA